jgi:hypothetical protein
VDAGEALDTHGEVVVGIGPIHDPPTVSGGVARGESEAAVELRQVGVLGADEMEFGGGGKVWRRTFVAVTRRSRISSRARN